MSYDVASQKGLPASTQDRRRALCSKLNRNTVHLISKDAPLSEVAANLIKYSFLFCVDFEHDGNLIGVISPSDFESKLSGAKDIEALTAWDFANKECYRAKESNIEEDLKKLRDFRFIPVVDDNDNFTRYLTRDSKWTIFSSGQEFEEGYWRDCFESDWISTIASENARSQLYERIFGDISDATKAIIQAKTANATVIEIGTGPIGGILPMIYDARERIAIEPLADQYAVLRDKYGLNMKNIGGIRWFSQGADVFIPELADRADIILCENALDHSPDWMFILGNMAQYTKPGGNLYLITDIDHHASDLQGHYNITYNPEKLYLLLNSLGFDLIEKSCFTRANGETTVCAVGVKR